MATFHRKHTWEKSQPYSMLFLAFHWCFCVCPTLVTSWPARLGTYYEVLLLKIPTKRLIFKKKKKNRFLYWRVCCFVCTREPRRNNTRRSRRHIEPMAYRTSNRQSMRAPPSIRRSVRLSQRTADSGYDAYYEPSLTHAYSDTELRYTKNRRHSRG